MHADQAEHRTKVRMSKEKERKKEKERGQEDSERLERGGETWNNPEDKKTRRRKKGKERKEQNEKSVKKRNGQNTKLSSRPIKRLCFCVLKKC